MVSRNVLLICFWLGTSEYYETAREVFSIQLHQAAIWLSFNPRCRARFKQNVLKSVSESGNSCAKVSFKLAHVSWRLLYISMRSRFDLFTTERAVVRISNTNRVESWNSNFYFACYVNRGSTIAEPKLPQLSLGGHRHACLNLSEIKRKSESRAQRDAKLKVYDEWKWLLLLWNGAEIPFSKRHELACIRLSFAGLFHFSHMEPSPASRRDVWGAPFKSQSVSRVGEKLNA